MSEEQQIDLEGAVPFERYRLRDGTTLVFVEKLNVSLGANLLYKLQSVGIDPPHDCFRSRDGRLSQSKDKKDGRDIVAKILEDEMDMEEYSVGHWFRLRNGEVVRLETITPVLTAEYRWIARGVYYRRDGTHRLDGGPSLFDILEWLPNFEEDQDNSSNLLPLSLMEYPLGQLFKRRDGVEVRFKSKSGPQKQWPFKVGRDTYRGDGFFMSANQPNSKDLVEVVPTLKEKPLSTLQAGKVLLLLHERQRISPCTKKEKIIQFLQSFFK